MGPTTSLDPAIVRPIAPEATAFCSGRTAFSSRRSISTIQIFLENGSSHASPDETVLEVYASVRLGISLGRSLDSRDHGVLRTVAMAPNVSRMGSRCGFEAIRFNTGGLEPGGNQDRFCRANRYQSIRTGLQVTRPAS